VAQREPTPVPSWEVGYALRSPLLSELVTSVPYPFRFQMAKVETFWKLSDKSPRLSILPLLVVLKAAK
jgi:hypothetical protein